MRISLLLLAALVVLGATGCSGGGAAQAANSYYNLKAVSTAVEESFTQENAQKVKNNIASEANKAVDGYEEVADNAASRVRHLREELDKDVKEAKRASIKVHPFKRWRVTTDEDK
jgi:gamma-glutamyl:cysteine ligase YbdK (ATP-grasp superfamily)